MLAESRPTLRQVIDWSCLTRTEIARRAGIARDTLTSWELGEYQPAYGRSMDLLRRLGEVLGEGVWAAFGFETEGERCQRQWPIDPTDRLRYRVATLHEGICRLQRALSHLRYELEASEAELRARGF